MDQRQEHHDPWLQGYLKEFHMAWINLSWVIMGTTTPYNPPYGPPLLQTSFNLPHAAMVHPVWLEASFTQKNSGGSSGSKKRDPQAKLFSFSCSFWENGPIVG